MEVSKADMVAQLDKAGVESDVKLIENEPQVKNNFICSFNFQKGWRKYDFWAQDHFRVSSRPLPHWFTSKGTGSRWAAVATGGGSCRDFNEQVVQCQGEAKGVLQGGREKYVIYNTLTNGKNENTCNKIITKWEFSSIIFTNAH